MEEANLQGAKLIQSDLAGATLLRARVDNADLTEANLSRANLDHANLTQCKLVRANLQEAKLTKTVLQHADFQDAILSGADLTRADLGFASLKKAKLNYSRLQGAGLTAADFLEADLTGASLADCRLDAANFTRCRLVEGDLSRAQSDPRAQGQIRFKKADLTDAVLTGANLTGADLTQANFQNATMIRTNLSGTITAGMNLGGTDVTNAELPEEIKRFDGLQNITDASAIGRKLYGWLLAALAFSGLTIASTHDIQLLTNATTSPLPVIQTPFPIAGFYFVAPVVLFAIFIYFHLQLQHQWRLISKLPSVFPDGTPLDEKIFPWLLNTWVRNLSRRKTRSGWSAWVKNVFSMEKALHLVKNLLVVAMAWYATPVLMTAIWARYLSRHDWLGTRLQIILMALAFLAAILLHFFARQTLRNKPMPFFRVTFLSALVVVPILTFSSSFSFKAIQGDLRKSYLEIRFVPWEIKALQLNSLVELPTHDRLDQRITHWLTANFSEQNVSFKPDNYDPDNPDHLKWVRGAPLNNANLNYAHARVAFLTNAKLSRASLVGANLYQSQLQAAILTGADLTGADLRFADLANADLTNADLTGADLREARLTGANLTGVKFTDADLANADISNTVFFEVTDLTTDQVKSASHWREGIYEKPMQIRLGTFFTDSRKN